MNEIQEHLKEFWFNNQPLDLCQFAIKGMLIDFDKDPNSNIYKFICQRIQRKEVILNTLRDIYYAFNLDTAVGDQLDKIGALVDLSRQGFPDDRYRTFIRIQTLILFGEVDLLSGERNYSGFHETILKICRLFIGPTLDPVILLNFAPKNFTLNLPDPPLPPDELRQLVAFIKRAIDEEVLGYIAEPLGPDTRWGSVSGPIVGQAFWGSVSGPVANQGIWSHFVFIGD